LAECRDQDVDVWFAADASRALSVCGGCRVAAQCLAFAVDQQLDYGVFGGRTAEQRAEDRKAEGERRRRSVPSAGACASCGRSTPSGWKCGRCRTR